LTAGQHGLDLLGHHLPRQLEKCRVIDPLYRSAVTEMGPIGVAPGERGERANQSETHVLQAVLFQERSICGILKAASQVLEPN
jgi:hypothetical protein